MEITVYDVSDTKCVRGVTESGHFEDKGILTWKTVNGLSVFYTIYSLVRCL